ncbi:unnamed protein product, partial [Meganyctiphanes norvegica]
MALSVTTLFGYGFGHVLNDLCSAMWFTYLLVFFHHVLQFNSQLAGIVLLIGQIADGLSTIFVGSQADRTDDTKFCMKYGRRKTWHLVGCICVVCAFPFIFLGCIGCGSSSDVIQVIYFAPFVIIFQFGWAATQISHLSLIPSITQDVNDRTVLNAIRYAFTVASNITVYLITWLTLGFGGDRGDAPVGPNDAASFRLIMFIVVGIGFIFAALFHFLVKEVNVVSYTNSPNSENCVSHKQMCWRDWFKEPQFYQVAVLYMTTRLFCNLTQAYVPIYLQDSLHLPGESVAYIPLVMYVSGFITAISMKPINKVLGRKVTYIIGTLIGFGGCVWVWFGDGPLYINYLLYIVTAFIGSGGSTMLVTSLSITADLIGPNVESGAFVYGAMSFTDKLSNGMVVMFIQSYAPCGDSETVGPDCLPLISQYYRNLLALMCSGFAILGMLATLTLLHKDVGQRNQNSATPDHTSIYSERTSYEQKVNDAGICFRAAGATMTCCSPGIVNQQAAGSNPAMAHIGSPGEVQRQA